MQAVLDGTDVFVMFRWPEEPQLLGVRFLVSEAPEGPAPGNDVTHRLNGPMRLPGCSWRSWTPDWYIEVAGPRLTRAWLNCTTDPRWTKTRTVS